MGKCIRNLFMGSELLSLKGRREVEGGIINSTMGRETHRPHSPLQWFLVICPIITPKGVSISPIDPKSLGNIPPSMFITMERDIMSKINPQTVRFSELTASCEMIFI